MEIIESQIIGKKSQETCEDGIVVTDNFIAVIDGSTSKTPVHISPDMKNGRYCMLLIKSFIESMSADITMEAFCEGITRGIRDIYQLYDISLDDMEQHPEKRLAASAIIYSRFHNEIWMVGDCQCIVDGKLFTNDKPYEARIAQKRVDYILEHLTSATDKQQLYDEGRQHIVADLIEAMQQGQNKEYAVIDGFPIYIEGMKKIEDIQQEFVLASDGYPFLCPTLSESEARLKEHLAIDPQNLTEFKATKGLVKGNRSFDDRAFIKVNLDNS